MGWVLYVEEFVNTGHNRLASVALVLVGLWIPAWINLSGVKNMGLVQVATTVLEVRRPGVHVDGRAVLHQRGQLTRRGTSAARAPSGRSVAAWPIALFSYLGVETAAVAAGKVRDPGPNIPRSTVFGTLATAVVYMLSLTAVFGILSTTQLASATAPFSDAANAIFGGSWAGNLMALAVIISGFGALNGWTMICAEMPLAAANDGLFPERFRRLSPAGVPAFGIIASTALASIAMAVNYIGSSGATVFTTLVLMTGITAAIPYGFSALAQIKWRRGRPPSATHPAVRARHGRRRPVGDLLGPVHLVLAQHRPRLLGLLGSVPHGGRRAPARHPRVPRPAPHMTEPEPVPAYREPSFK